MKRVKVQRECPNPLFEKWLNEWKEEARVKGSSVEHHFAKAISSLRKYPLPLESGRDCILLQHFGTKLCAMLDKKLKKHLEDRQNAHNSDTEHVDTCDDIQNDIRPKKSRSLESDSLNRELNSKKNSREKKQQNYNDINRDHSKNRENETQVSLKSSGNASSDIIENIRNKKSITKRSRIHSISSSDSDSLKPPPVMKVLDSIDNDMCEEMISKSNEDNEKSKSKRKVQHKKQVQEISPANIKSLGAAAKNADVATVDEFYLDPNTFDVLLLVDTHETAGGKTKSKDDATISELNRMQTTYEVRHLKIGDFAWVARCKFTQKELILPYIVERKRMDDLGASIKDGRFHEQKFRLKQSGIPNIIYMVESYGSNQYSGIPMSTLLQASTNSLVQDGFTVKFTRNHRDSMQYLTILTTLINRIYKDKKLVSSTKENVGSACILSKKVPLMEFKQFNKAASKVKTYKVKEMFIRQLLQLKGMSLEKTLAVVERYPTPVSLSNAFLSAGRDSEKLLANIQAGALKRQLGPALSKTVHQLYTKSTLD